MVAWVADKVGVEMVVEAWIAPETWRLFATDEEAVEINPPVVVIPDTDWVPVIVVLPADKVPVMAVFPPTLVCPET